MRWATDDAEIRITATYLHTCHVLREKKERLLEIAELEGLNRVTTATHTPTFDLGDFSMTAGTLLGYDDSLARALAVLASAHV
jgi:hypothetical protein